MNLSDFLINISASVIDAMKTMDLNGHGILFLTDNNILHGSVTDGDIRRWIIKDGDLNTPIINVANKNPHFLYVNNENEAKALMKSKSIKAIPIVGLDQSIHSIIFSDKIIGETPEIDLPVVLMAGGKGTRLKPYTEIIPKPLIPIGKSTILERIIDRFLENMYSMY